MNYSGYSYLILCEDKRQYYLVHSWLCRKGAKPRRIRPPFDLPEGSGDAKRFVESHYPSSRIVCSTKHEAYKQIISTDEWPWADSADHTEYKGMKNI